MSLRSPEGEIIVENGGDDMNEQDPPGVDMIFSDVLASSQKQNKHQEINSRKFPATNAYAVLQKGIDALKYKFSDFTTPKTESDWLQMYDDTLSKSKTHALSYEDHLWSWLNLITTAKDLKKSEFEEIVLNCYENAIVTLPIKISEDDTTWVELINGLYCHILNGDFTHTTAKSVLEQDEVPPAKLVLEAAEKKFKYSPKHARVYWNAVMKNEKHLMKSVGTSQQNQTVHMAGLYKKRYSNPYLNMAEGYNEFVRWSLDVNLPKDLRLEVQNAFLQHSTSENMSFLTSILERTNPETTAGYKHHLVFEDWIENLCKEENPNFEKVEVSCEEIIAEEPESFCYYWISLHALASPVFEGVSKREEKIHDIIQRGWKCGKRSCEAMEQHFLEQALVVASRTICVPKVLELIENALTQFPVTDNSTKWYASSRGIIIAISNLAHGGQLDTSQSNFEKYFEKVISPCTMELFKSSHIPESLAADKTSYETKYFELVKLWVATQESCYNLDWPKVVNLWTNIFMNNQSPIMLVGYVDFVRSRGTYEEAIAASNFALEQMFAYEQAEIVTERSTRRCYIKLLQGHLQIVSAAGKVDQQIFTSQQLQRKLNVYTSSHGNEFQDLITSGSMLNGFHPLESIVHTSSLAKLNLESPLAPSSSDSLATKLKSMRVRQDSDSSEKRSIGDGKILRGFKIFVSNLNYHANEEDVAKAFKDKGFYPLKVEIKRTAQGKSLGHGYAEFDTKDTADLAINTCDKFKVRGRSTFVSEFKAGQRSPIKKPPLTEPTALNLTNLPPEWKDEDKIANKLSCYGHIKNVTVEEQDDTSFTVRVQFHMTDDAKNAYVQIMDKKVFEDTNVICRMGYASKKRELGEENGDKKKVIKKRQIEEKMNGEEKVSVQKPKHSAGRSSKDVAEEKLDFPQPNVDHAEGSNLTIGPQMPPPSLALAKDKPVLKPTKGFNLIPMQVRQKNMPRITKRTHMKARLDVGETSSASFSTSSNKVRRIDSEEEKNQCCDSAGKRVSGGGDSSEELDTAVMEEEANETETPSLSNKDFQLLFKKDS